MPLKLLKNNNGIKIAKAAYKIHYFYDRLWNKLNSILLLSSYRGYNKKLTVVKDGSFKDYLKSPKE